MRSRWREEFLKADVGHGEIVVVPLDGKEPRALAYWRNDGLGAFGLWTWSPDGEGSTG